MYQCSRCGQWVYENCAHWCYNDYFKYSVKTYRNYKCPCGGEFDCAVFREGKNRCPFCNKVMEGLN